MRPNSSDRSFFGYYVSYFGRPGRTLGVLLSDRRRVGMAALALLVPALGYTVMYTFAWLAGGAPSTFKPWLAIPIEQYFTYDIFIVSPSMYLSWIVAAGSLQLISGLFSDKGSFEDTATIIGFGAGVGMWAPLAHDLTDAALGVLGVIDMKEYEVLLNTPGFWSTLLWTIYSLYFLWLIFLFAKGLRIAKGLGWGTAIPLGVVTLIIYQGVYLIFNR